MKKYKISEFANKIGVSSKTLRHYEKYQIVTPMVNEESGYRFYNFRDAERIIIAKRYASLGISIKESAKLIDNASVVEIAETLDRKIVELENESNLLALKAQRGRELKAELELFTKFPNQLIPCKQKIFYFKSHVSEGEIFEDEVIADMMNNFPFVYKIMKVSDLEDAKMGIWGMGIDEQYAHLLKESSLKYMERVSLPYNYMLPLVINVERENKGFFEQITQQIKKALGNKIKLIENDVFVIGSMDAFSKEEREVHFLTIFKIND